MAATYKHACLHLSSGDEALRDLVHSERLENVDFRNMFIVFKTTLIVGGALGLLSALAANGPLIIRVLWMSLQVIYLYFKTGARG